MWKINVPVLFNPLMSSNYRTGYVFRKEFLGMGGHERNVAFFKVYQLPEC
jgi:hypothetical protein